MSEDRVSTPLLLGPRVFDVLGELPTGTTVLEASAGTGKTWTIATLTTRFVAEGRAQLPELLLVTFGREATQELRERVRERLVGAERALRDPGAALTSGDPLLAHLADGDAAAVAGRRRRLADALSRFDAATIATVHQFCRQVLAGLGTAADIDPDAEFVERIEDLVTEVVDDFYVRKWGRAGAEPPAFSRAVALMLARSAVGDPQARLEPADADPRSAAAVRFAFATAVRGEVARRLRVQRRITYDDLLVRLRDTLEDPVAGPTACAWLRERHRVVLVDEFQDTDPVQWRIVERAFHGHTTLVLIGDPKQAIYAFRGADVASYLTASRRADAHATLGTNHRSDGPLLAALDTVFAGAALGDERIVVRPVDAAHPGRRLTGAPSGAPVRLRVVPHDLVPPPPGKQLAPAAAVREVVVRDLAADVAALLASPARLAAPSGERPVRPGDVAVLVRTNQQGTLVRDALARAGIPGVLAGTASVFGGDVATQWLTLLEAVEQPARPARMRAAALTCFLGGVVTDVAALCGPDADAILDELGATVRGWAALLRERGVAALVEAVTVGTGLPARLLGEAEGERRLTDVRHVGQALHHAAVREHLGPAELVEWLRRRIAEAGQDTGVERSRRLESDAEAVQIITVHRSKGLEFPVVHVPFAWDRWAPDPDVALLHEDGRRILDVGGPTGGGWERRCGRHRAEEAGEDLRLLYVAMTRARCQLVTWWAPATTTSASPLHRLLIGRPAPGGEVRPRYRVPGQAQALAALHGLASQALAVEEVAAREVAAWRPPAEAPPQLQAAEFTRRIDTAWRRTSYSALTAAAHGAAPATGSEPEEPGLDDETAAPGLPAGQAATGLPTGPAAPGGGPVPGPDDADGAAGGGAPTPGGEDPAAAHTTAPGTPDPAAAPTTAPGAAGGDPADPAAAGAAPAPPAVPSPWATLPVGASFGTLVHAVLEVADTTAPDLGAEIAARVADELGRTPIPGVDPETLVVALAAAVETPLGPLADGARLRDVAPGDRLSELTFEFPLAGGDAARRDDAPVTLDRLVPLLRRHLGADDPLAAYPDALADPALGGQALRGYLTGSIDAVLRLPGPDGPRFTVVDYKTNWLGPDTAALLTTAHYDPDATAAAMIGAHYPLQALIYAVALHRYLRWRLPGYEPQRHLGGVLYLFVRGMCGPDTPQRDGVPAGVFSWRPPAALVVELSELLAGEPR
ncbi:MAG: UvrD-helicase domain-containing protein [Pseudonocardia sp.]